MFIRQAKATPDNIAIVTADGRQMTYRELDDVTDVLATNLRIKGVQPDSVVGIYLSKVLEYPIAYIAILKAGKGDKERVEERGRDKKKFEEEEKDGEMRRDIWKTAGRTIVTVKR